MNKFKILDKTKVSHLHNYLTNEFKEFNDKQSAHFLEQVQQELMPEFKRYVQRHSDTGIFEDKDSEITLIIPGVPSIDVRGFEVSPTCGLFALPVFNIELVKKYTERVKEGKHLECGLLRATESCGYTTKASQFVVNFPELEPLVEWGCPKPKITKNNWFRDRLIKEYINLDIKKDKEAIFLLASINQL